MGWTFMQKPADPKAELDRMLTWESTDGKRRVLASALTAFMAVFHPEVDPLVVKRIGREQGRRR